MALVVDGTTYNWYEKTIVVDGATVSSPDAPGSVVANGTEVFGLNGFTSETTLFNFSLAPDSATFENSIVPQLQTTYAEAFHSQGYTQGPGQDTRYTIYLKEGYRLVTNPDGTFTGSAAPGTSVVLYEGGSVTGANASHNGSTSCSLRRDDGI